MVHLSLSGPLCHERVLQIQDDDLNDNFFVGDFALFPCSGFLFGLLSGLLILLGLQE